MFDPAPSAWTGGLRRSPARTNLPIITLEDLLSDLFTPQPSRRSSVNKDMDVNSPTSPISPSSSEQTSTPRTPKNLCFDLAWETSQASSDFSLLPRRTVSSKNSKYRRVTVDHTQTLPGHLSHAERWSHQRTRTLCVRRSRMSLPEIDVQLSTSQASDSQQGDQDGDVAMSSPKESRTVESERSIRRNTRSHKRGVSSTNCDDICEADMDSALMVAATSAHERTSVPDSDSTTLQSSRPRYEKDRREHAALPEVRQHRRTSTSNLRGRSQDRATGRAHRRTTSNSQSRSRIANPISSKPPRLVVQVPDTRKTQIKNTILHLGIPLVPLISVTTGLPHPDFPRSILQYHLLTHNQLDSLARWYHQTVDNTHERFLYPAVIERPWVWQDERAQLQADRRASTVGTEQQRETRKLELSTKRRRFGRFIGLRGCETPTVPDQDIEDDEDEGIDVTEQMEREWTKALKRAEEEEKLQEKVWRGRW